MAKLGLWVQLEAKEGKADEVQSMLEGGAAMVEEEPGTVSWFAIRTGPTSFGVFDAFDDEEGRQAHLEGEMAAALMAKAGELLAEPPKLAQTEILGEKLPG
jgi:quinol monooxygenase YgiN